MTLYTDTKLQFTDLNVVSSIARWHTGLPLLAVGSYHQEKGGFVTIFQESGQPLEGCDWPTLVSNQVTALAWHPLRKLLVVGWDGGELYIWLEGSWARLEAPHNAALITIAFSIGGGRLVTSDNAGSFSGWQTDIGAPLTSFNHQLGEVITHITFCTPKPSGETTIRGLARAAVAGDENALDALAAWRPRTTAKVRENSLPDNHCCYAALDNNIIMYIDHSGSCKDVLNAPGNIQYMSVMSNVYLLIAWEAAGSLSLTKFIISNDGSISTDTHVRLASKNGQSITSAGYSSIAVITGESLIRIWDSDTGENDVLPNEKEETPPGDVFTSMSYCNLSDTLCCGTSQGHLFLWRRDPRHQWKLISSTSIKGTVKDVSWGSEGLINPLLFVNCITVAYVLREQPLCWGYSHNISLVQKSANELGLTNQINGTAILSVTLNIRALAFKDQYLAIGDGSKVQVYSNTKENPMKFTLSNSFLWKTDVLLIHEDMLVGVAMPHLESRSVSGSQLGMLPSSEGEGDPIAVTNTSKFVAVATLDGCIKIVEITRKGLRMPYPLKNCYQMIEDFGEVMHCSVNSSGRYICLSVANAALAPDPKVYVWDAANDVINSIVLSENSLQSVPISILWDAHDPRLTMVHMRSSVKDHIYMLFCHENTLHEHKNWFTDIDDDMTEFSLVAVDAPYIAILSNQTIKKIKIKEFSDIKDPDSTTLTQTLEFIFDMTIGQLEKAVVIGANLAGGKSQAIWNSLARACVDRKRPDVGAICLGKMGNLKGALMMRNVMNDPDYEDLSKVAVLAINLDMIDEAKALLKEANRTDLITRLLAAKEGGLNEIAESVAQGENILLLKSAQHKLAKTLCASGEIGSAIKMFERAGTHVPHVPRTLISLGQTQALAKHVASSEDENMIRWWGHYLESLGDMDGALEAYARISDYGEQTRLLCHMHRIEEAEKLYEKSPAAMYHMARHLELQPHEVERAVKLYIRCGAVCAGMRVATEARAWSLVWRAGNASSAHALHAAAILETAGHAEQAMSLYQKAGKPHMALKLALTCGDTSAILSSAEALGGRVDGALAQRLADHLRHAGHHAHAAAILASAGQFEEALNMVENEDTPLSEELGEKLAAPDGTPGREALLRRLADVLGARGLYHLAAKRLAQAGDKLGAMRWLLRSGDADRIALFASACRERSAQLLAAEHLRRHAPWGSRPDLTRHILQLYGKARAHGKLAAFYAEWAKLEVDEYDNFEKALDALREAIRCLGKVADPDSGAQTMALQEQCALVKKFIELKRTLEAGETAAGMASGKGLLHTISGRSVIITEERILALLLQYCPNHPDAYGLQERLKSFRSQRSEESRSTGSPEQSIEEVI